MQLIKQSSHSNKSPLQEFKTPPVTSTGHNHIQCNGHFVIDLTVHLYIALSIQKELEESTASN